MSAQYLRRRLIVAGAGLAALGTFPGGIALRVAKAADVKVRMTTGLLGTNQSIAWIGSQAGVFGRLGLDVSFPKLEVGGPEAAIGMTRGDWEFCQTGTLPIAEGVLSGRDPVILLRNTLQNAGLFVMTRREFPRLEQLAGKRVGVLTDAYSGQTGVNTRRTVEKASVTASYIGLGTYQKIFAALVAGEIEAGAVPIDLRFLGERQHGWHAFATDSIGVPSVFATTRTLIASNRPLVMTAVRGMVETIHLFKTRPDVVLPLLQGFLNFTDRQAAEDLYNYYLPFFPPVPRPDLGEGMQDVRASLVKRYPAAATLQEADIADASFINELEQSGFIGRLYAGEEKR